MNTNIIIGASGGIGKFLMSNLKGQNIGTYCSNTIDEDNYFQLDLLKTSSIELFIKNIKEVISGSRVSLIFCNGSNYNSFLHKADSEKWLNNFNSNFSGNVNLIIRILPTLRENNWGRIIFLSSVVAQMGIPGTSSYSAAKSAMWGFSKCNQG